MPKQKLSKKIIHLCIIFIIIIAIIFTAIMFILKYDEQGEINMPFNLNKINIISTIDGKDMQDESNKWNIEITQNNDLNLYIERNEKYRKQEVIKYVKINNITVLEKPKIGDIKIYKPINDELVLYKNIEENSVSELEYVGAQATNNKNMEISNQGGVIQFRCSNLNIGTYISNEDEEINYKDLIKKINIKEEDIIAKIAFDLIICLNSGKAFKAEVILKIPNEGIVENGKQGLEINDLNDIVFKRVNI